MSPHLTVGLLADLERRSDPVAPDLVREFEDLNRVLKKRDLEPHSEPQDIALWERESDPLNLHCLRRLAANLDLVGELPTPGTDENVDEDEPTNRYYELAGGKQTFLTRVFASAPSVERHFDHLIVHRDNDGFYLPIDFEAPIEFRSRASGPGWIGSSLRVLEECEALAKRLAEPDAKVMRFDRENACLELLREACARSRESGAALILT